MIVLVVFIITIGAATIIEEAYDTATAKLLVYNAVWFELLMLVLVILYTVMMFRKHLFHRDKIPQLIFHFSFALLFIGGGITRYFGFEANMHILENEAVRELYTAEPYLQIRANNGTINYSSDDPLQFSQIEDNYFRLAFDIKNDQKLLIEFKEYTNNAKDFFKQLGT